LDAALGRQSGAPMPPESRADLYCRDKAFYIYTSGTTGLPKAARINHYRWVGAGLAFGLYGLGARREDVIYCPLPLYHSNGILIAFGAALVSGAALALSRRFSASRFWDEAYGFGATAAVYIGEILRYLVNAPPAAHERDHRITRVLGNGLRPDIWELFRQRFGIRHVREFYASTEGNAYTLNMNDVVGSVGQAILKFSENTLMVRYDVATDAHPRGPDGFLLPCAPGETGELLARVGPLTPFYGYAGSEETEKKLLRNVFRRGDVYFRTGDLMMKDAAGNYYFVDRIGDTFRWKGENVATHEVQEILSAFPGLALVGVFGVTVPGHEGRAGMAALMMEPGRPFDPAAFHRFAEDKLPPYMRPAFLRVVARAELTGTYKLKKLDLQQVGYDPGRTTDPLYYRDAAQGAYLPLDAAAHALILAGKVDF